MKRLLATTAVVLVAFGSSAFAANSITTKGLTAKGDTVTIPDVKADQAGYVVIHAVKDGKVMAPQSIGHTMIKKGDNKNVKVTTDYPLEPGESYAAMLHKETNNNGKYDFGEGMTKTDTPVMQSKKPVVKMFKVGMKSSSSAKSSTSGKMKSSSGEAGMSGSSSMSGDAGTSGGDMSSSGSMDASGSSSSGSSAQ